MCVDSEAPPPLRQDKLSLSAAIEMSLAAGPNGSPKAPPWLSWIEQPFRIVDPGTNESLPEVRGWALDAAANGPFNTAGIYIGAAVLRLAIQEAQGPNNPLPPFGLKPSSLLTAAASAIGILAAILMPIVGAVVDHTKYRKHMAVLSAIVATGMVFGQFAVLQVKGEWVPLLVFDAIQAFAMLVHHSAVMSYLPDLARDESSTSHLTSRFSIRQTFVNLMFLCIVLGITAGRNLDSTDPRKGVGNSLITGRDAAAVALTLSVPLYAYAWTFLMRNRPALTVPPEDSNLLTVGFVQVIRTCETIVRKYKALSWLMVSLLFSPEGGAGVVLSIALTYLTVALKFDSFDISIVILLFFVGTIPGAMFSKFVCRSLNSLHSYRLALISFGLGFGSGTFLFQEGRKGLVFAFVVIWGFSFGWVYPSQRNLLCYLIPAGQTTEMMGLFTFAGQIIGWLPPLITTIMNENDVDLKWSLMVILLFSFFPVILTLPMGSYEAAVELAAAESAEKLASILTVQTRNPAALETCADSGSSHGAGLTKQTV